MFLIYLEPNDLGRLVPVFLNGLENELSGFMVAGSKLVVIVGTPEKHGFVLEQRGDDAGTAELLKFRRVEIDRETLALTGKGRGKVPLMANYFDEVSATSIRHEDCSRHLVNQLAGFGSSGKIEIFAGAIGTVTIR